MSGIHLHISIAMQRFIGIYRRNNNCIIVRQLVSFAIDNGITRSHRNRVLSSIRRQCSVTSLHIQLEREHIICHTCRQLDINSHWLQNTLVDFRRTLNLHCEFLSQCKSKLTVQVGIICLQRHNLLTDNVIRSIDRYGNFSPSCILSASYIRSGYNKSVFFYDLTTVSILKFHQVIIYFIVHIFTALGVIIIRDILISECYGIICHQGNVGKTYPEASLIVRHIGQLRGAR